MGEACPVNSLEPRMDVLKPRMDTNKHECFYFEPFVLISVNSWFLKKLVLIRGS